MNYLSESILGTLWIAGVVVANGFWSTAFAIIIPFYAWYLIIEAIMKYIGII